MSAEISQAEALFDKLNVNYEEAFDGVAGQHNSINWVLSELEAAGIKPAKIVDIGCGTGRPVCERFAAAGHDVLGVDLSSGMIEAARERVPMAKFEKCDVREFNPPAGSYDVVTVFFSLIAGVTQADIRATIARIYGFIKPGGLFVFATVPLDAENADIMWMGQPVRVSSISTDDVLLTIKKAGFEVASQEESKFKPEKAVDVGLCGPEDVWEEDHIFVYAKRPSTSG